ncbi:MAG TPA: TlpA disulfide reductase family protein [Polyangiaceae bacterium]|nr:TlpA disulfide reductase family protein [Polyangiaceae bacterium]
MLCPRSLSVSLSFPALLLALSACKVTPEDGAPVSDHQPSATEPSKQATSPTPSAAPSADPTRAGAVPQSGTAAPNSAAAEAPAENPAGIRVISGPALRERFRRPDRRATLLNVWASWCGPCRREFPMLTALEANLRQRGVVLEFVSVDEPDGFPAALEFAAQNGKTPPLWVAERPLGPFKVSLSPSWKGALPVTFLFDNQGELRHLWNSEIYDHELIALLDTFLRGDPIPAETNFAAKPGLDYRK